MTLEETRNYLFDVETQVQPALDRPYGYFDGEKMAGSIGIYKIDFPNRIARIGYWIDVDYERQGLVTKGAALLIDQAFHELDLNRIEIRCAIHGGFQDLIMYAMLAKDWRGRA